MNKSIILDHDREKMAHAMMRENPEVDIFDERGTYINEKGEEFIGTMGALFKHFGCTIEHHDGYMADDNYFYRNNLTKRESKAKRATKKKERQRKKKGRR